MFSWKAAVNVFWQENFFPEFCQEFFRQFEAYSRVFILISKKQYNPLSLNLAENAGQKFDIAN